MLNLEVPVATLKGEKETDEINFNNIFCLTLCIPNVTMLTESQYKIADEIFFILFCCCSKVFRMQCVFYT